MSKKAYLDWLSVQVTLYRTGVITRITGLSVSQHDYAWRASLTSYEIAERIAEGYV